MPLQEISENQFNSYNPLRHRPADNPLTKEVAWFEAPQARVIGLIVENKQHDDFSVVSFAKSGQLRYQAYDMTVAISSFSEAKTHLREIM